MELPNYILQDLNRDRVESLCETLFARGFLVERNDHAVRLSDNSHGADSRYLHLALQEVGLRALAARWRRPREAILRHDVAEIVGGLSEDEFHHACLGLIGWRERYGVETACRNGDFRYYDRRAHGFKLAAGCLDAGIAAFVKAVSAIGASTEFSCSGHRPHSRPWVSFVDDEHLNWARAAGRDGGCRVLLGGREGYRVLRFGDVPGATRQDSALEVARDLYARRLHLRTLRARVILRARAGVDPEVQRTKVFWLRELRRARKMGGPPGYMSHHLAWTPRRGEAAKALGLKVVDHFWASTTCLGKALANHEMDLRATNGMEPGFHVLPGNADTGLLELLLQVLGCAPSPTPNGFLCRFGTVEECVAAEVLLRPLLFEKPLYSQAAPVEPEQIELLRALTTRRSA